MHLNYTTITPFQALSNSFTGHPAIYWSPCHSTHKRAADSDVQITIHCAYNTCPATTTSPKSKVRKRDVRNANNTQPVSVRLVRLLNCRCCAATQTLLVPTARRSGSGTITRQYNQKHHPFASWLRAGRCRPHRPTAITKRT